MNPSTSTSIRYPFPVEHHDVVHHRSRRHPRRRRNFHWWWSRHRVDAIDLDGLEVQWMRRGAAATKAIVRRDSWASFDYDDGSDASVIPYVIHFDFDGISSVPAPPASPWERASPDIRSFSGPTGRGWNHPNNARERLLHRPLWAPVDVKERSNWDWRVCWPTRSIGKRSVKMCEDQSNELYVSWFGLEHEQIFDRSKRRKRKCRFTSDQGFHAFLRSRHAERLSSIVREAD